MQNITIFWNFAPTTKHSGCTVLALVESMDIWIEVLTYNF